MAAYRYVIIGSGRQGTAAAYDLARFGEAASITMADVSLETAGKAADRVNRLSGTDLARPCVVDVTDFEALKHVLSGADVALSAVPYYFNLPITRAAIDAGVNLCDTGGNTDVVQQQLLLAAQAQAAGVSILPDCGMGPGLINVLAVRCMELLDETREIVIYDAGLPQNPKPPWNYELAFHINGLTNEYDGTVALIRDGQRVEVEALTECQTVELEGFGTFESFIAAGGSTAAWTFEGKLQKFETRILRYPGHYAQFKAFQRLGLFGLKPISVGDQQVVPREVFHALLAPQIMAPDLVDVGYMRAQALGIKDGRPAQVSVDVVDHFDAATGFRAMERLTGWHCAIMMGYQARRVVPPGARPLEQLHLDGTPSAAAALEEVARRGIQVSVTWDRQTVPSID